MSIIHKARAVQTRNMIKDNDDAEHGQQTIPNQYKSDPAGSRTHRRFTTRSLVAHTSSMLPNSTKSVGA